MTEAQLPISAWEHIQTMVREIASQHAKRSSDKSAINALDDVMSFLHLYEDVLKNTPPHSIVLSESQKRLLLATKPVFSSPDEKLRLVKEIGSTTTFDLSSYKGKKKRVIRCQRLVSKWVTRLRFRNSLSDLKKTDPECKRMVKRNNVWFEIIETERSYVQGLNDLENTFITPMKQSLGGAEILSRKDFNFLVSNINSIKIFNESLLAKLEELQSQWPSSLCIGAIFNEHAPYLRMYKQYVNNFSNSYVVRQGNKKNARFQELLIEGQRALHGRSLTDLLILPIQRIPRYQMLMRELLKHTPEEHMDYGNIKSALIAIEEITEILDQSKKDAENLEKIFNVFQNLSGDIVEPLIVPNRKYIREGDVKHHGSKRKKHLYLFSDILIVALVNNDGTRVFEELIRLVDCSLTDSPSTSSFTIINGKHKEKWIVNSIPEKMAWIVDIQSSIELQRKSSSSGNSSPRNRSSSLLAISPRVLAPSDSQTLLSTTPPK